MDGWMDWMDGWMDEWMDEGWVGGCMDGFKVIQYNHGGHSKIYGENFAIFLNVVLE